MASALNRCLKVAFVKIAAFKIAAFKYMLASIFNFQAIFVSTLWHLWDGRNKRPFANSLSLLEVVNNARGHALEIYYIYIFTLRRDYNGGIKGRSLEHSEALCSGNRRSHII